MPRPLDWGKKSLREAFRKQKKKKEQRVYAPHDAFVAAQRDFSKEIDRFRCIKRTGRKEQPTSLQMLIRRMAAAQAQRRYVERVGKPECTFHLYPKTGSKSRKFWQDIVKENEEEILCMAGVELETVAGYYGVDPNLPTKRKQEITHQALVDDMIHGDPEWSKNEIKREKERYLKVLESIVFINSCCKTTGIDESVVRGWMRTDPDFATSVTRTQQRFGERITLKLVAKAVGPENDMAAQMYLLKMIGKENVKFRDTEAMEQSTAIRNTDISHLSIEEQETVLRLLRKAQEGKSTDEIPMEFDEELEYRDDDERALIEHEVDLLLEESKEPEIIDDGDKIWI